MTTQSKPASIAQRAARGSLVLLGRQAVTLLVTLAGGVLLARLLTPAEFGSYALIVFIAGLTKLLVDGGLAASLVQQKDEPTRDERSAVFTFQLAVALVLASLMALCADPLAQLLGAVDGTATSIRLAALAVAVAPLTSMAFVQLERQLKFSTLGLLLTIQPVAFNVIAVLLAALGLGVASLGFALALSNLLVVPAALLFTRALPPLLLRRGSLNGRFRFGLPFIGGNLVSTLKDGVNPLFVGVFAGASAAGYVNWAQQVAIIGTYLLAVVARLLFPILARLKDDPEALPEAVSKILFWANMLVAPITVFLAFFAQEIALLVYGGQWLPAVPLLYVLLLSSVLSPTASVLSALLNAIGKPSLVFYFAIAWAVATWVLVPIFVSGNGFIGYGYANAIVQVISIGLIVVARREVKFHWSRELWLPWLYSIVSLSVVILPARLLGGELSLIQVALLGVLAVGAMAGLLWTFSRDRVKYLWRAVFGRA